MTALAIVQAATLDDRPSAGGPPKRGTRKPRSCLRLRQFGGIRRRLRPLTVECADVNGPLAVDLEMPGEARFADHSGGDAADEQGAPAIGAWRSSRTNRYARSGIAP
jgi:hypothetical protein